MTKLYSFVRNAILSFFMLCFCAGNVFGNEKMKIERLKAFIPSDYELLDIASGDINGDRFTDYVLILKSKREVQNPNQARPLLLVRGKAKGKLELMARNDRVVLCSNCGGVFGDPSPKITIKDKLLSIESSVGNNWRYTRVITFKYDTELEELILHKDFGVSYHVSFPNKQKNTTTNEDDFDKLSFADYSYNKGY